MPPQTSNAPAQASCGSLVRRQPVEVVRRGLAGHAVVGGEHEAPPVGALLDEGDGASPARVTSASTPAARVDGAERRVREQRRRDRRAAAGRARCRPPAGARAPRARRSRRPEARRRRRRSSRRSPRPAAAHGPRRCRATRAGVSASSLTTEASVLPGASTVEDALAAPVEADPRDRVRCQRRAAVDRRRRRRSAEPRRRRADARSAAFAPGRRSPAGGRRPRRSSSRPRRRRRACRPSRRSRPSISRVGLGAERPRRSGRERAAHGDVRDAGAVALAPGDETDAVGGRGDARAHRRAPCRRRATGIEVERRGMGRPRRPRRAAR